MSSEAELFTNYLELAQKQEAEVAALSKEISALRNDKIKTSTEETDPEALKLIDENQRLKYRIQILQRSVSSVSSCSHTTMINVQLALTDLFMLAVRRAYPDLPDAPVTVELSKLPKLADYQCNSAMPIAQLLKSSGISAKPRDIASNIISSLPDNHIIERLEAAGPGFINITLNNTFIVAQITDVITRGVRPPKLVRKRVIVDFSAPNIAKEMHVGHLRSTVIGDSICRLLEFLGHDVLRLNHVGDWGTQFGMLIAHLADKFPNYEQESPSVQDLQAFYKESKARFDADEEFKKRAYSCVVKLQSYDPSSIKAWNLICDVSRREYEKIYSRLGIKIEERGESFYQKHMEALVKMLTEKELLIEDEGRKILFSEGHKVPLTVVKSDGGFTYDTSDLACIKHRVEEGKADWIIYVTDAGQADHFKIIFGCASALGFVPPHIRVDHVGFGVVLGEDKKKFKTRSGEVVKLTSLLDEGLKRSLEKLHEKEREKVLSEEELQQAQRSVAYGCVKYADLSHNRNHDYVFSFDKMLDDKGNTAVYLLYSYTRIASIARNANITEERLLKEAANGGVVLQHPKEIKLAKALLRFTEVISDICSTLCLHTLAEFLYGISTTFTEFYDVCYCVEKDQTGEIVKVNMNRLLLCQATANIIAQCFTILGIDKVHRM